jgi:hypothetical protein
MADIVKGFDGESKLLIFGLTALLGVVIAAYLAPALQNNILQLGIGVIVLFLAVSMKGTDHIMGGLRIMGAVVGSLFAIRGALGFVPSIASQVHQLTYNVI